MGILKLQVTATFRYIFFELLPVFLMGMFVFLMIILMTKIFDLTEYAFAHGASAGSIALILIYICIGMLPVLFPMSMLFSILICYGRMSADSEIVAMKSLGLSTLKLSKPAWLLAILVFILSAQTSFYLAPWGESKMEEMTASLLQAKPTLNIREGVFSEGFFDFVIYANEIDKDDKSLKKLFIYDERNPKSPLTIIAQKGEILSEESKAGVTAKLKLSKGSIHRAEKGVYSKVDFDTNEISLFNPLNAKKESKSPAAFNLQELEQIIAAEKLKLSKIVNHPIRILRAYSIEYHKRWAQAFACLIFTFIGLGLGIITNRRNTRANGFIMCVGIIIGYWVLYAAGESLSKSGTVPVVLGIWFTNFIFLTVGGWLLWPVYKR